MHLQRYQRRAAVLAAFLATAWPGCALTRPNIARDASAVPTSCPQPFGVNLLKNGGFETGDISPWRVQGILKHNGSIISPGYQSKYCYHATGAADPDIRQSFPTCAGHYYTVTARYKVVTNKPVQNNVEVTSNRFVIDNDFTGGWDPFEVWFIAENDTTDGIGFDFYNYGPGVKSDYYFDSVAIKRIQPNFAAKPGAKEMVGNAGFESGQLDPWVFRHARSGSFKIVSPGLNGSKYAFEFVGTAGSEGQPNSLSQRFNVTRGTRYLVEYTTQRTDTSSFAFATIDALDYRTARQWISEDGKTLHFRLPVLAQSDSMYLYFEGDSGPTILDSVSVKELA